MWVHKKMTMRRRRNAESLNYLFRQLSCAIRICWFDTIFDDGVLLGTPNLMTRPDIIPVNEGHLRSLHPLVLFFTELVTNKSCFLMSTVTYSKGITLYPLCYGFFSWSLTCFHSVSQIVTDNFVITISASSLKQSSTITYLDQLDSSSLALEIFKLTDIKCITSKATHNTNFQRITPLS